MRENLSLLLSNVNLLGITDLARSRYDVNISIRTFTVLENHKRAFEIILYHLIQAIDAATCKDRLNSCFPCSDGLKAKEFRNCVFKWLNDLKRSSKILKTSLVRRSLLDDCAGERYEDLLYNLSTHVLLSSIRDNANWSTFQSSNDVLYDRASTIETLHVHDLIQAFRLRRLHRKREMTIAMYKDFSERLKLHEAARQESEFKNMADAGLLRLKVDQHVSRIAQRCSGTSWVSLVTPAPLTIEEFFVRLPWSNTRLRGYGSAPSPSRDLKIDKSTMQDRVGHLMKQVAIYQAEVVDARDPSPKIEADLPCQVSIDAPVIKFKRAGYADFLRRLQAELASLEPSAQTLLADSDIDTLRQLTPKRPTQSRLPRPQQRPEIKDLSKDLLRSAIGNRVRMKTVPHDDRQDEEQDLLDPCTPKRGTIQASINTVRTIDRLIDVLNDSSGMGSDIATPLGHKEPNRIVPYRGASRNLEQSFRLWET